MDQDQLDRLDDKIFAVVCEVDRVLNLRHDVSKYNHTDLIISVRQSITEELERQRDEHE